MSRHTVLRAGRGPVASAASQAAGLLQVGLLLLHGGATNATDTFFYLFVVGLTPTLILVVGVMYPMLLNGDAMTRQGLRRIRRSTPALAVASVVVAYTWLSVNRDMEGALHVVAAIMSVNAALQAGLYVRASAAEAGGDPLWISGIALPANIAACAALAWPWGDSTAATTAMVTALAVGNAASFWWSTRRRIGQPVLDAVSDARIATRGSLWFLGKSSVGYLSHVVLSSLAVTLPASGVTVLSLANRLVGAVATTLTNAVLPTLVHRSTETITAARRFLRLLLICFAIVGVVATGTTALLASSYAPAAAVISLWLVTTTAAAVAQRTAFRFLPARAVGPTIAAVLLIVTATVAAAATPGFDVVVLLCGFAALDASTAALLLWRLGDRGASMTATLAFVSLATLAGTTLA